MKRVVAMSALFILLAREPATFQIEEVGNQDEVQGATIVSAGDNAGRKAPPQRRKGVMATFTGHTFNWKRGDDKARGTLLLSTSKSPREISMSTEIKTFAGICRLERDELKIYFRDADDRPGDFATNDGRECRPAIRAGK
jgi:uncharacterized protein (TIGR03067 family)